MVGVNYRVPKCEPNNHDCRRVQFQLGVRTYIYVASGILIALEQKAYGYGKVGLVIMTDAVHAE